MPGADPAALDLSRTSVFVDFDGTISTVDVGMHLLGRAASEEWWELHEQFERGEIGSRECIFDQWALVEGDEATLRAIAAQLEKMRERTPRGGRQWAASSVKSLLDQARRLGLAVHDPTPGVMSRPSLR